ncbi:hypothetical protein EBS67_10845 [bacterium]|nr:hypothetical protein [bacterium]NBT61029.1 hypothetical protein [Planctomycetia bacterium]
MTFLFKNRAIFSLLLLTFTQVSFANDFYPLEDGSLWKYQDSNNKTILKKAVREEKLGYYPSVLLEVSEGKTVLSSEHIGVTNEGVFRFALDGKRFDQGALLLKDKPKVGDKWPIILNLDAGKLATEVKVTEEEVAVPFGKFKCLVTTTVSKDEKGTEYILKNYYAQKVGVVKVTIEKAGKKYYELQLLEFKLGSNKASDAKGVEKK